jgi:hypothetical protein
MWRQLCGIVSSVSSRFDLAFTYGRNLRFVHDPHGLVFIDSCKLPLPPSFVLLWGQLTDNQQKQCFFSVSDVLRSEVWYPDGDGLVSLASKWRDPDPNASLTLKRVFKGDEPVVNSGLILRELLNCEKFDGGGQTVAGSKIFPDSALVKALLRNVGRHVTFSARDSALTQQLVRAAYFPSIRSIVTELWNEFVELVPSYPVVVHNVDQVSFSETRRMYVAVAESTREPVFESHFKLHPQAKDPLLDFEHFFVPFQNASAHRDARDSASAGGITMSLTQALVETNDIDIFGTVTARALCSTSGRPSGCLPGSRSSAYTARVSRIWWV